VRCLLRHGADRTATDFDGFTAWDVCLHEGTHGRAVLSERAALCAKAIHHETEIPLTAVLQAQRREGSKQRALRMKKTVMATEQSKKLPRESGFHVPDDRLWIYNLNAKSILPFLSSAVVASLTALHDGNSSEIAVAMDEFTPGVFAFPLLSETLSQALLEELERIEHWARDTKIEMARPNSMNRYGLRLREAGLQNVAEALVDAITPMIHHVFGDSNELKTSTSPLMDRYAFTVRYRGQEDRRLDTHVDSSRVTLNVCLGKEFCGGGVYFHKLRSAGLGSLEEAPAGNPDPMDSPHGNKGNGTCDRCQALHQHSKGVAIMHLGRHIHGAVDIKEGERVNLVIWCRSSEDTAK